MISFKKAVIPFAVLVFSLKAFAISNEEAMKSALSSFQKGEYTSALATLKKASNTSDAKIAYWTGQCEFKLQKYDAAIKSFKVAAQNDAKGEFKDTRYLLGQSYYATQDYKQAKPQFENAAKSRYKPAASKYYIGYIENILGDDEKALKTFAEIESMSDDDAEMKQAAKFQTGEIYFERAKKISDKDKKARDKVYVEGAIPAYEKTIEINKDAPLAKQAGGRLIEIRSKLSSEVPKTAAGLPKPKKAWVLKATQDVKYDTNIVNEADGKVIKISNTGSFLEKTDLFGKYEFNLSPHVIVTPELDANATFHSRRKFGSVFSNDTIAIAPAVRGRYDHVAFDKPASGLAEIEYSYNLRDFKSRHAQLFYNQSINYILGERVVFFPWSFMGNTTVKGNYKFMIQQNPLQNYRAYGLSIIQAWTPYQGHSLTSTFSFEQQRAKDVFYDQRTYKTNASYSIPSLYWDTTLDIGLNMTYTDTQRQYDNRGNEVTTNPTVTWTKNFDEHWSANLNYAFTRNSSRDNANYTYSKHVFGIGGSATF